MSVVRQNCRVIRQLKIQPALSRPYLPSNHEKCPDLGRLVPEEELRVMNPKHLDQRGNWQRQSGPSRAPQPLCLVPSSPDWWNARS